MEKDVIIKVIVWDGPRERDDLSVLKPLPLPEPVNGKVFVGLGKGDAGANDSSASVRRSSGETEHDVAILGLVMSRSSAALGHGERPPTRNPPPL